MTEPRTQTKECKRGTITVTITDTGWSIVGVHKDQTVLGEAMRFEAEIVRCPEAPKSTWPLQPHVACDVDHKTAPDTSHLRAYCHGWHHERVKKLLAIVARTYA